MEVKEEELEMSKDSKVSEGGKSSFQKNGNIQSSYKAPVPKATPN